MLRRKGDQIAALKAVPLFAMLPDKDLKAIHSGCREELYSDGQAIVNEGSPGGPFFLIVSGHAKVTVGGRKKGQLGPGDYFGEIALIDKSTRMASVIADGPVSALAISSWDFLAICEQDFRVALKVMTGLAARVRAADKQLY